MELQPIVSIVLATYNERDNILAVIQEISESVDRPLEIIVVDDNSPDGTWKLVEDARIPNVRVIRRMQEKGLASAFYRGIQEANGQYIGWMDADRSMPAHLLPVMLHTLDRADIAVASRYVPGGGDERSWMRVWASQLINGLARLVLNPKIGDFDSGFALVKRRVIEEVPMIATGYGEYFIEFLYAAGKKRFQIEEVPYVFRDRKKGETKSAPNLWHFFKTGCGYITRIFVARFRT